MTLLIALSLSSCETDQTETTETESATESYSLPRQSMKIGYSAEDSLNPFMAQTSLNVSHAALLYQSLFSLDNAFTAVHEIAEYSNIDGTVLTVNIGDELLFSDGSRMSAEDVIYSYNLAKQSPLFKEKLAGFVSAQATGVYEITFTLAKNDNYCRALLDFPIVKNGSADNTEDLPTGSGLYMYRLDEDKVCLIHNKHSKKPLPSIGTIELINIEDSSTLAYALETGKIDAYYTDLNSSKLSRVYASTVPVYLNNLVYIGFNTAANYTLSLPEVRRAISYAANRADICGTAYQGNASAAYTLFNPSWAVLTASSIDASVFAVDYSKSISLLEESGFTNVTESGVRSGSPGSLSFRLIVNNENEYKLAAAKQLAESLIKAGIRINIVELSWEEYLGALNDNNYDLYMGEVKIPANMDFSAFFTPNGNISYGIDREGASALAFAEYTNGTLSLEAFNTEFQGDMPLVPLCYRNGLLIVNREITGSMSALPANAYGNIYEWNAGAAETETASEAEISTTYSDVIL